jgi:hypothetical protein
MALLGARAMPPPPTWRSLAARNALLASLSADALRRWQSAVEHVRVTGGQILAAPGMRLPYAYFPLRGVVALVAMTAEAFHGYATHSASDPTAGRQETGGKTRFPR